MTPAYLRDMQIIDERLTALENKVEFALESLIKIEKILLEERRTNYDKREIGIKIPITN